MSIGFKQWVVEELMKPVVLLLRIIARLYKLFFGRRDIRVAKEMEKRYAQEIRNELSFLFEEHGGKVIPDEDAAYPRPCNYITVIVATDNFLFSFTRGRGELTVEVAPARAPNDWDELVWALASLGGPDPFVPRAFLSLRDVAEALKPHWERLREAYSEERRLETKQFLTDVREHERILARQLSAELNQNLRTRSR